MTGEIRWIATATATTTANGTYDPFGPEAQRARDTALAISLCECGHKRILHYDATRPPGIRGDWRGATGPCHGRKGCECNVFRSALSERGDAS